VTWPAIWAIVRKDLASVLRNRGVRIPLLVTPAIILVFLPVMLVGGGELLASSGTIPIDAVGASPLDRVADPQLQERVTSDVPPAARWAVFVLEVFLAPLYLLVPLVVATVIAADSFAGERERGTLEALLHTPTRDRELMLAKFLAAWLPAISVAWAGFLVYSVLANVLAWPSVGRVFFPTPTWLLLAFWVAPAVSALGLGVMVIVSGRVRTLQAAHQIGSLIVLPVVLLLVAQLGGVLLFEPGLVAMMGLLVWLLAAVALWLGAGSLRRERLAERM
jgi:ABC-2 type transport system permease protein